MQKSIPSFLFLNTNSRRGTEMGPGRGGLIKNPNKALQPLVARGKVWAQAFHRPSHQGALTNISGASACPWLHYPFRRDKRSIQAPQCCPAILSSRPLQPHPVYVASHSRPEEWASCNQPFAYGTSWVNLLWPHASSRESGNTGSEFGGKTY